MADIPSTLAFLLMIACADAASLPHKHGELCAHCTTAEDREFLVISDHIPEVNILWDEDDRILLDYPLQDQAALFAELEQRNLTKYLSNTVNNLSGTCEKGNVKFQNLCATRKQRKYYPLRVREESINEIFWTFKDEYFDLELCGSPKSIKYEFLRGNKRLLDETNSGMVKCVQEKIRRRIFYMSNDVPRRLKVGYTDIPSCCSCYASDI